MDYKEMAVKIHKENIVIDAHLDLGAIVNERKRKGEKDIIKKLFLDNLKEAGFNFVVGAIYVDDIYLPELALRNALDQIIELINEIDTCDDLVLIKNGKDMEKALKEEKIGIIISLEGAEPIQNDLNLLNVFYKLGVRGLGLTWSRRNFVADGSYFGDPEEGIRGGLTPFGIEVLKKAEDLGFFIDISHINYEGFKDVLKYSEKPFMASHSNCRKLNNISRNLSDEQITTIAKKDGVIGINTYKSIVSENKEEQNIDKLCDHIEHIIKISGKEHVGYGFDLCGMLYDTGDVDILKDHRESLDLTAELLRRGHKEETVKKIIGRNLYDFYLKALD